MVKKISILSFTFMFLFACVDEVKLSLRQVTKKIIIEGMLTNDKSIQYIRLYYTNPAVNVETIDPVKGALVQVTDSDNVSTTYKPTPNLAGLYMPENTNFKGITGKSYSVYIKLSNGNQYKSAPQLLLNAVSIDNLTATFKDKNNYGYLIDLDFTDPKNETNYYRWKGSGFHQRQSLGISLPRCCDRCWVLKEENSVNVFSDIISNGSTIKARPVFFSPFYLIGKHFIEIQQLAINKEAYQFWIKFDKQTKRTGTIFDALPATIAGNVKNTKNKDEVLLGFFEVAAISKKRIIPIAGAEQGLLSFYIMNDEFAKPDGDCMLAFRNATYFTYNPPGW